MYVELLGRQSAPKDAKKASAAVQGSAAPVQQYQAGSKQPNLKELIKQSKNAKKR